MRSGWHYSGGHHRIDLTEEDPVINGKSPSGVDGQTGLRRSTSVVAALLEYSLGVYRNPLSVVSRSCSLRLSIW